MRRIVYMILALITAYLCFDIYRLYTLRSAIDSAAPEYMAGPEDADLTVVEFLDYGCKFCREIHPAIIRAIERDGAALYIPRPVPASGDNARRAALLVYAAGQQGKFMEMHDALMRNYRILNDVVIADLAAETGTDAAQLRADMHGEDAEEALEENKYLFLRLNRPHTPLFVINKVHIYMPEGQMPAAADFLKLFERIRTGGS